MINHFFVHWIIGKDVVNLFSWQVTIETEQLLESPLILALSAYN